MAGALDLGQKHERRFGKSLSVARWGRSRYEREFPRAGLELENYNQTNASMRLGISEANLRYLMKKHGVQPGRKVKAREQKERSRARMLRA